MKTKNLFWGIFFILSAVAIILNQLGILEGVSLLNLIITILLIPIIIKSIKYMNFFGILTPLAIIGILYADKLGIQSLTPWPILGAAIFLSIGLSFIIHPKKYPFEKRHHRRNDEEEFTSESVEQTETGEIDLYGRFSGSIKYISSENLKKVNLDCSFGAMKVYFDNAKLDKNIAVVDVNIDFAGVELYVPKTWKVINNVNCVVGGIDEKGKIEKSEENIQLILKGKLSFSGIEIIYI